MAVAYTPTQLANLQNDPEAVCKINYNANLTQTALQDALSLSGNSPNQMESNLDMNSNRILNLPAPASAGEPVRLADITSTTALALSYPKMTGVITATGGSTGLTATFSGSGNLPTSQLNGGVNANSSNFWRGDGTWANPASVTFTGNLTFSTGSVGIAGCTDTSSASAGQVGEYISTSITSASQLALVSGTASTLMSISLTPGDWDITGEGHFAFTGANATSTYSLCYISTASAATLNTPGAVSGISLPPTSVFTSANGTLLGAFVTGPVRASLAATATYYNVALAGFSGTVGAYGTLRARRVR